MVVVVVVVWQLIVDVAEAKMTLIAGWNAFDSVEGQAVQLTALSEAVSAEWWTGLTEDLVIFASDFVEKIAVELAVTAIAAAAVVYAAA